MRSATPSDNQSKPTLDDSKSLNQNNNLRLLLENYEVFVPQNNDLFAGEYDDTGSPTKRPQSSPEWDSNCTSSSENMRSKSAPVGHDRIKESNKDLKAQNINSKCLSRKHKEKKALTPTVRHVVTEYINRGKRPKEYFWSSPSKRLDHYPDHQEEHHIQHCIRRKAKVSFASTFVLNGNRQDGLSMVDGTGKITNNSQDIRQPADEYSNKMSPVSRKNIRMIMHNMSRCHKQRKMQELPIKVFNPQFPDDCQTLRHVPLKDPITSNAADQLVSRPQSGRSDVIEGLNLKYSGQVEYTEPIIPQMVVLGKGLQMNQGKVRIRLL